MRKEPPKSTELKSISAVCRQKLNKLKISNNIYKYTCMSMYYVYE